MIYFQLKHYLDQNKFLFSRAIWESNLKVVNDHNLKADLGVHTFWLGMNKYADLVRFCNNISKPNCSLFFKIDHHRIRQTHEWL